MDIHIHLAVDPPQSGCHLRRYLQQVESPDERTYAYNFSLARRFQRQYCGEESNNEYDYETK
jgi:hypothetical protein